MSAWAPIAAGATLGAATGKAVFAAVLLGAAAILGVVVVMLVRKRIFGDGRGDAPRDLTLGELRQMRDRGTLTEDEFQRARAAILRAHGAASAGETRPNLSPPRADGGADGPAPN